MRSAIYLFFVFSLAACLDTIELDLPNNGAGRMAIEGVVERSLDDYRFLVSVRRTQNLESDTATHLESAIVWILLNDQRLFELENGVDLVIAVDSFERRYQEVADDDLFNVEVETSEGKIFRAQPQKILEGNHDSSMDVIYEERQELNDINNLITKGYVKLLINAGLVNEKSERISALWTVKGEYRFEETAWTANPIWITKSCYVKDAFTFNNVNVFDAYTASTDRIEGFEIGETDADYRFNSGYYFTAIQKAVSQETAAYWLQVKQSISREGTLFDTPVGALQTNIEQIAGDQEEVLGFFYTAGIDTVRYLAGADETGFQRNLCAFGFVSDACCDCLLLANSTATKPFYWIE